MKGKLLLLGLGLLSTALLVALALSWLRTGAEGGNIQATLPDPLAALPSAKQAYSTLEKWLPSWAEDAVVVAFSTTIERTAKDPAGWTFQVYSPGRQQIANVLVEGQQIWVLRELAALYPQEALPLDNWRVDSDTALKSWWNERGELFWDKSQTVTVHMGRRPDGGLLWKITLLNEQGDVIDVHEARGVRSPCGNKRSAVSGGLV